MAKNSPQAQDASTRSNHAYVGVLSKAILLQLDQELALEFNIQRTSWKRQIDDDAFEASVDFDSVGASSLMPQIGASALYDLVRIMARRAAKDWYAGQTPNLNT